MESRNRYFFPCEAETWTSGRKRSHQRGLCEL